jgi:hypothetical protein
MHPTVVTHLYVDAALLADSRDVIEQFANSRQNHASA